VQVFLAIKDIWLLSCAGYVFAREGLLSFIPTGNLPLPARLCLRTVRLIERRQSRKTERSKSFSNALHKLGPSWIKLGQFLSTRPDIIGPSMASDLECLQDKLPPFSQKQAEQKIIKSFGKPVSAIYASLGPPIAAASIAQVHRAQLLSNGVIEDVAVKILRPHIEARFARDLHSFYTAARLIERLIPKSRRLHPVSVVQTLARSVTIEMDLRLEAAALSEMADNTAQDSDFIVPQVKWQAVAKDVLTTEWIEGIPLNDIAALKAAKHDLKKIAQGVVQNFLRHALCHGFFHADMHQGNLFADAQGRLVAVDYGIMGRLSQKERYFLAEILWSFISRDYQRGAKAHFEAGYVPPHQSPQVFAQALRAIGEPIHLRKASEISMAQVLAQLFDYTELFDMETRCELLLLQKTMAVTEGVARNLDPEFDMWASAKPVVEQWMGENLGPKGQAKRAARLLEDIGGFLRALPEQFESLSCAAKDGLRLSPESLQILAQEQAKIGRWQTAALWIIALALLALLVF
jgi:ubiquinone biosynthesis protein